MEPMQEIENRLWDFIDGASAPAEKTAVENLIRENEIWKLKYAELMQVQKNLQELELEQPSMRFTKNVMEQIAQLQVQPAAREYINRNVIRGIGIFFLTLIGGFIIYALAQINWKDAGDSKSSIGIDFAKVDYSRVFDNQFVNGFMVLNIILGLMLLDRYLSNRKRDLRERTAMK